MIRTLTVNALISGIFYTLLLIATTISLIYGIVYFVKYKKIKKSIIIILTFLLTLFLGGKIVNSMFGIDIQNLYGVPSPQQKGYMIRQPVYGPAP